MQSIMYLNVAELDLKRPSKGRQDRDRAERGRGELNAAVRSLPSTSVPSAPISGPKVGSHLRKAGMLRARAWVPYGAGSFSPHCIPMLPLLPGRSVARSRTGGRLCRQVSLSKRTLARSREAAPGLSDQVRCAGPVGCIGCDCCKVRHLAV